MTKKTALVCLVSVSMALGGAGSASAAIGQIVSESSLLLPVTIPPAPALLDPPNPIPVEARILPSLALRAGAGTVPVIVGLYSPAGVAGYPRNASEIHDPARVSWVRAAAQTFAGRAASKGFVARHGTSHLPIVFGEAPIARLREIAADPLVSSIGHDGELFAQRAEGAALMRSRELLAAGGDGSGIGVAVMDTGIDWQSHSELNGQVTAAGDFTGSAHGALDVQGHGTACAGIVAGRAFGMAPKAHLWNMKVLADDGKGQFSWMIEAFNQVLAHLNEWGGVHVVSASLGAGSPLGPCDAEDPTMASTMGSVIAAGVTIFVASGNEGCSNGIAFPACVSHAIAVGAVYDANVGPKECGGQEGTCTPNGCIDWTTQADQITCYSNSGSKLEILGPSDCATTTGLQGETDWCFNGTSAATPYVAGVAAQLKSAVRSATPAQIRDAMKNTGRAITDPRNGITRNRVDAVAARQRLGGGGGTKSHVVFVPASAKAAGSGGTSWVTDLRIFNQGTTTAAVDAFFLPSTSNGSAAPVAFTVPSRQSVAYNDAVSSLFRLGSGSGAIRFESDQPLLVSSDTYTTNNVCPDKGGTFGQYIPGSPDTAAGTTQRILHLINNAAFRCNVGVVNTTSGTANVSIKIVNGNGSPLGSTATVTLGAYGWKQINGIFNAQGAGQSDNAFAVVASDVPVLSYTSVVDNKTGDPIYVPGTNE